MRFRGIAPARGLPVIGVEPSMRHLIAILAVTACSYTPPSAEIAGVDAPGQEPDASTNPPPPPTDSSVEPPPPPQVTCTTSDPSLKLCLEFEDAGTAVALDGSGAQHDASLTGVTATTRDVPANSRALQLGASSTIMIGDSPDFDVQTLTISAWVKRSATPAAGQRYGVVDVGRKQAALALDDTGRVTCMVRTDFDVWVGTGFQATSTNEWSLVACTYDAPELCMYTFKNGSSNPDVECGDTDGEPINMSVNAGGTIGALFDASNQPISKLAGSVDSIRVYGRALTENQLCTANGLSGC